MSDLPDLSRLRELRPDLRFPSSIQLTGIYFTALKAVNDGEIESTEEALLAWIEDRYPDPRGQRSGRPRNRADTVRRRFETTVRALRAADEPARSDDDVASSLGVDPRQIRRWRRQFRIPYARDVTDK